MAKGSSQRNLSAATDAIKRFGGEVIRYASDRKHIRVRFRTARGNENWMQISHHPVDAHKFQGWVRQAMNRADVTPASNRVSKHGVRRPNS